MGRPMESTVFATSVDQFTGAGRRLIELKDCDGSSETATLEFQLKELGLVNKWRHEDDDRPGTVFYWFKHCAAQVYEPEYYSYLSKSWMCGVCGKKNIHHVYTFRRTGAGIVNITEDADVLLPVVMRSGCVCIHLADELKSLTGFLIRNHMVRGLDVRYRMGRVVARDVIDACHEWDREIIAMPVQWFYFTPIERKLLMLGQSVSGYGFHVYRRDDDPHVLNRMKRAGKTQRTMSAFHLFQGKDEYGNRCDIYSDRQAADKYCHVILTRRSAWRLSMELSKKEPV